ncbi:MAG: hypothetical protein MZV70_41940 [Desulfobacterales bacterium]|nr:hypothetical protein [Desulfobacterales bacterium]
MIAFPETSGRRLNEQHPAAGVWRRRQRERIAFFRNRPSAWELTGRVNLIRSHRVQGGPTPVFFAQSLHLHPVKQGFFQ